MNTMPTDRAPLPKLPAAWPVMPPPVEHHVPHRAWCALCKSGFKEVWSHERTMKHQRLVAASIAEHRAKATSAAAE